MNWRLSMQYGKWLLGLLLIFISTNAVANERTYLAAGSMPFKGYYADGGLHNISPAIQNSTTWDIITEFIMELPRAFPKGSKVHGITRDGKHDLLTIRKVDTGALFEGGFILDPPIVYKETSKAELIWTPGVDINGIKTEKTNLPKKLLNTLRKKITEEIKQTADAFQDSLQKKEVLKIAQNLPDPVGYEIDALKDLIFITAKAGKNHFFIYSKSKDKIAYSSMDLFPHMDYLSGDDLQPLLYFQIVGHSDIYLLAYFDDGYEGNWYKIMDASTGETLLNSF